MNVGAYYVLLPKAFACEIIGIHEHCIGLTVWRELAFVRGGAVRKNKASAQLKAAFASVDDGPRRKGKRSEAT